MDPLQRVRAQSQFETWAGKPFSRASRFHHLIEAPELGSGLAVRGVKRPDPAPALDFAEWEVHAGSPPRPVAWVKAFEYGTLAATHESLMQSLASITVGGVEFSPVAGGPGDVSVQGEMVRDNLLLAAVVDDASHVPLRIPVLRAVDAWLLGDWPLAASRRARPSPSAPLAVALRVSPGPHRAGEPVALALDVRQGDRVLDADRLPHRIAVEPGRIERSAARYVFTPSDAGTATVSASVFGPAGEHGAAALTIEVR